MTKKQRVLESVLRLEKLYPDAICSLDYKDAFQLLIATRLSAQCTDKRVNIVTPDLFAEFPTSKEMAKADLKRVEQLIKTCGLYKTKALDLIKIAQKIESEFGGKVPDTIEELTTLSGVGRKTANLVCGDIYGKPAVVTDTHFIRICNRLGFVSTDNPLKVENEMRKLLPPEKSNNFCHRTVLFGRDVCTARTPKCDVCLLNDICPKNLNK
ncbi:MAG: endonuclease III [Ruminococcaceae bacterium]|nr:endonuclease III [Oscillospiraceae bacterium]